MLLNIEKSHYMLMKPSHRATSLESELRINNKSLIEIEHQLERHFFGMHAMSKVMGSDPTAGH